VIALAPLLAGSGEASVGANYPPAVQARIQRALERMQITVLQERATGTTANAVLLANGAKLACDVPLLATGAQAPGWLQTSGLALDASGFVCVDETLRSTRHPQVFAAGDVSSRVDRSIARSGVYAVRAGVPLANNLRAVLAGVAPLAHQPPVHTLNLLSTAKRYAIGSWWPIFFDGRWVFWLKDRIDRGFIRRYAGQQTALRPGRLTNHQRSTLGSWQDLADHRRLIKPRLAKHIQHLLNCFWRTRHQQATAGLRVGQQRLVNRRKVGGQLHPCTVGGPVASRRTGHVARQRQITHAWHQWHP